MYPKTLETKGEATEAAAAEATRLAEHKREEEACSVCVLQLECFLNRSNTIAIPAIQLYK